MLQIKELSFRGSTIKKIIFVVFTIMALMQSSASFAGSNDYVLKSGYLAALAPPYVNKKYYLLEFGFVSEKIISSWDYKYNAYVTASLFEDWLNQTGKLRAGGLGFKGGVMLPTQPWIPLLFTLSVGFAKTVLHNQPIVGYDNQSAAKKDMFLIEGGALYHFNKKYFLRYAYQLSNVKYFKRHTFLELGVTY
jgi:hypothetical protein